MDEEYIKERAVLFLKWIQQNCTDSIDGYFFNDFVGPHVQNDFSIEELYDIFIEENKPA